VDMERQLVHGKNHYTSNSKAAELGVQARTPATEEIAHIKTRYWDL